MTEFILRTDYLLAAAFCASKEKEKDRRPYLHGVYVEPHPSGAGVIMVATDGTIMAVLHDPKGLAVRPAILTMNWRTSEIKTKRSASYGENPHVLHILSLSANVGTIKMRDGGEEIATVAINEITEKFPDWRRVLPTDASKEYPWRASGYNMEKLAAIHRAITLLDGNKTALDILPGKDSAPAIIRHEGPADAVFVIMPRRRNGGVYVPPAWLSATPTKGKAT